MKCLHINDTKSHKHTHTKKKVTTTMEVMKNINVDDVRLPSFVPSVLLNKQRERERQREKH